MQHAACGKPDHSELDHEESNQGLHRQTSMLLWDITQHEVAVHSRRFRTYQSRVQGSRNQKDRTEHNGS